MARMKLTPKKADGRKTLIIKTQAKGHAMQATDEEAPPTPGEIKRRKMEAEKLEEVGRSPVSLFIQHLAQMAVEARPSTFGWEAASQKEVLTDHRGQGSPEGIPTGQESEEAPEEAAGYSGYP